MSAWEWTRNREEMLQEIENADVASQDGDKASRWLSSELRRALTEIDRQRELVGERDALEARRASVADDLRLAKLDQTARLHTICSELGGLVEGLPTASHNYLQRIRELRQIEAQLSTAQADAQGLREALRTLEDIARSRAMFLDRAPGNQMEVSVLLNAADAARAALGAPAGPTYGDQLRGIDALLHEEPKP